MKLWEQGKVYSRDETRVYVECYEQPWWAHLRWQLFHVIICPTLGRWTWLLRRTGGWPDTGCFELGRARRTVIHYWKGEVVPS